MVDITEIYVHWYAGRSKSALAASLGVDRNTVRKYLAPAEASGITPGGPPMSEADWAGLIEGWFPGLVDRRLRQVTWSDIDQHRDYIKDLPGTVTVSTIHQRLRDEHKLKVSISSFRRWVHATLPYEVSRSQVTVLRKEIEPGEEAQIDYGFLGQWINPRTDKRHRVWAFVMVLPCSRHMFVRPVLHLDRHAWTEAHVAAFRYFDGVPRRLVPDNLKTGVDKPDLYDPKINKAYAELGTHYGALVDPARALKPKDKPRVERPMPYVRVSFWRGREFTSIEDMQTEAVTWSQQVAGQRMCRPLGGAAPMAVFGAVEAAALLPLPPTPFTQARWSTATVGPDIHELEVDPGVEVDGERASGLVESDRQIAVRVIEAAQQARVMAVDPAVALGDGIGQLPAVPEPLSPVAPGLADTGPVVLRPRGRGRDGRLQVCPQTRLRYDHCRRHRDKSRHTPFLFPRSSDPDDSKPVRHVIPPPHTLRSLQRVTTRSGRMIKNKLRSGAGGESRRESVEIRNSPRD